MGTLTTRGVETYAKIDIKTFCFSCFRPKACIAYLEFLIAQTISFTKLCWTSDLCLTPLGVYFRDVLKKYIQHNTILHGAIIHVDNPVLEPQIQRIIEKLSLNSRKKKRTYCICIANCENRCKSYYSSYCIIII